MPRYAVATSDSWNDDKITISFVEATDERAALLESTKDFDWDVESQTFFATNPSMEELLDWFKGGDVMATVKEIPA